MIELMLAEELDGDLFVEEEQDDSTVGETEKSFKGHAGRKGQRGGSVARGTVEVYHGTPNAPLKKILKEGITKGKDPWTYKGIRQVRGAFVSEQKGIAEMFAESKSQVFGGVPVIFKIRTARAGLKRDPYTYRSWFREEGFRPDEIEGYWIGSKQWKGKQAYRESGGKYPGEYKFVKLKSEANESVFYILMDVSEDEEEKSEGVGPTEARVPDFEGEYPTPFQPLRVGYRGKRKKVKHLPNRHDQRTHGHVGNSGSLSKEPVLSWRKGLSEKEKRVIERWKAGNIEGHDRVVLQSVLDRSPKITGIAYRTFSFTSAASAKKFASIIAKESYTFKSPQSWTTSLKEADRHKAIGYVNVTVSGHLSNVVPLDRLTGDTFKQSNEQEVVADHSSRLRDVTISIESNNLEKSLLGEAIEKAVTAATASDAQLEASNYEKDHIRWNGLDVTIENKKGTIREGKKWQIKMPYDYGYIRGTEGRDGDQLDVCIGDDEASDKVFVVHALKDGKYDEDKVMLGYDSAEDAKAAFDKGYDRPGKFGAMTEMSLDEFKEKVADGIERGKLVPGAGKKVAERKLKSLVLMHLPMQHDQADHGRSRYRSRAIDESFDGKLAYSGLTEDEDGDKVSVTIYEVTKIRDPEKFVNEERTLIYDPATNRLYHAIDTEHLSIVKPLKLDSDKVVRFWTNPRAKAPRFSDWQSGVGWVRGEEHFDQNKALKNIDKASNKLVSLGMPEKSAAEIFFWKTGKTVSTTLKSLVVKHLAMQHDQQTHAGEMYHGTTAAAAKAILAKGLLVSKTKKDRTPGKKGVYATNALKSAVEYGQNRAELAGKDTFGVVVFSAGEPTDFNADWGFARFDKDIPASKIVRIEIRRTKDLALVSMLKSVTIVEDEFYVPVLFDDDDYELVDVDGGIEKHLAGKHDQSTHGRGGATEGAPVAETGTSFDKAGWEAKAIPDRRKEWEALRIAIEGAQTLLAKQVVKHYPGGQDHNQEDHAHPGEGGPLGKNATLSLQRHYQRVDTGQTKTVKLKSGKTKKVKIYQYIDSQSGKAVTDPAELDRIRKLVLPPGVGNVKINPDPNGRIQAQWRDVTGKSQSRYSKAHDQAQAAEKFTRLKAFTKQLPKIRAQVLRDLKSDDEATREAAAVVYLVDKTAFRIGNDNPNAKVKAYGASTLQNGHVRVEADGNLVFDFIGKKGVRIRKAVNDPTLTQIVEDRKTSKWSDPLFQTTYAKVNQYFDGVAGKSFLVKDFRTHHATEWALSLMDKRKGRPKTEKAFSVWQKDVATRVAAKMGHTASVSLNQYINPLVWDRWRLPEWGAWVPPKLKSEAEDD